MWPNKYKLYDKKGNKRLISDIRFEIERRMIFLSSGALERAINEVCSEFDGPVRDIIISHLKSFALKFVRK